MTDPSVANYLDGLNDVQQQAVLATDGPVLVVAGPGSGKTRVLTFRIAHLIEQGIPPYKILSLTFTNKAAREMKARIASVVGNKAHDVWAGTFHSIFARILRVEAEKIGYPSNFTIYDTEDSKSLINAIIKELGLDSKVYNVNAIRARISSAKSNVVTPSAYEQDAELMREDRMNKRPQFQKIYKAYMQRCRKSGAMDFDDLLYQLLRLFQENKDGVLEKYQQRFSHMLVDEFQDTNYLQYRIIKKLVDYDGSPRNICVVGDDAQSIYAFRGATIQNILDYEKDFAKYNIQTYKLEQNYRSTEHIVKAANEVITNNRKQIQKEIWSNKGSGQKIRVIKVMTDTDEGRRVADSIQEQKNRNHLRNSEIAILYRTNAQSRIFEEYLRRANLPYKVYGGLSFYQRKEVKDLIAYLRMIVNPHDEEAFRRSINYPRRGIGAKTVQNIIETANELGKSVWECIALAKVSGKARNSIDKYKLMIEYFRQQATQKDAHAIAAQVAKDSGLIDLLKQDTSIEGMNRLENVNALLDGIKDFVDNDEVVEGQPDSDHSLAAYLQNIALITDLDTDDETNDHVTLMSVHSAKGLEFKSIFIVGLEEELFPSFMATKDSGEGMDEERRLFYVAITRAEQFLTLSFANSRYKFGSLRYNKPSRFLGEIDPAHFETIGMLRSSSGGTDPHQSAGVKGNFRRLQPQSAVQVNIDPKDFKVSESHLIQAGMKVLHMKFGEGKVLSIDGSEANRIATIHFPATGEGHKKIMLRFAKLQILD